ncbi:MAG: DUF1580 domain-containing protein [Aureliella sp.]
MSNNHSLLPLVEAVENVTGQRIHLATALRLTQQGRRGHRLQSWVIGARRMTTEQAVQDFVTATTEAREPAIDQKNCHLLRLVRDLANGKFPHRKSV